MNITQAFKIAIKSILAKKGRSALTMLGIIIGIAAVIVLVSYAEGQSQWIKEYYASMGTNTININARNWNGRDISDDLYQYCQELDDLILGVTPTVQVRRDSVVRYGAKTLGDTSDGNYDWNNMPQIAMGNQQFSMCSNYTIVKGRDLSYLDVKNYNQVCVLGSKMAKLLFNYSDPVGQTITISSFPFLVVGVFDEVDPKMISGKDNVILVPYTLNRLLNQSTEMDSFVAKGRDNASTTRAITLLQGFLKGLVGENGYFNVSTPDQWQEESNKEQQMQQLFQGGIAAISLLVGGIGIMNIMLVTVTERTREIGIRKAIGAERKSIIFQFLIEASMICFIGGVIGVIFGYLITLVVGRLLLQMLLLPNPTIVTVALMFSVLMGVVFGLYPAIKASGLQPVEALRAD